ncbi:MAG: hypothetical protein LBB83_00750, partial [Treponema sp.]|nr:hypothetical protein [Treponema sp.]
MSIKGYSGFRTDRKYRIAAVGGTLLLSAVALMLTFSIIGALFSLSFIAQGLGNFFVQSYGVLAFLIPAYLVWAAVILAAPSYRPDRIFVLAAAIIPFMTLAIGIGFIQDFSHQADRIAVLQKTGKTGFSFFIVLLAFVEGMIIRAFVPLLFPELAAVKTRKSKTAAAADLRPPRTPENPVQRQENKVIRYLPNPRPAENNPNNTAAKTDAAATPGPKPADTGIPPAIIKFPEPKPLASARAFEELERAAVRHAEIPAKAAYPEEPPFPEDADADGDEFTEAAEESGELPDEGEFDDLSPDEAELMAAVAAVLPNKAVIPIFESVPPRKPEAAAGNAGSEYTAAPESAASTVAKKKFRGGRYQIPVDGILNQYPDGQYWIIDQSTELAAVILRETLEEFHIQAEVTGIKKGPVITMFEILPAPGVKLSRIVNLQDNIALRLAASSVRIVAPIPGKHAVGIEVPNKKRNIVSFREIIEGELRR